MTSKRSHSDSGNNSPNTNNSFQVKKLHLDRTVQSLFLDEETADFFFIFNSKNGQQRVPAHKVILIKESSAFREMFCGASKDCKEIEIVDVSVDAFIDFLRFFYSDNITITIENIGEMMLLATKYGITDLLDTCKEFIDSTLPIGQIFDAFESAVKAKCAELRTQLEKRVRERPEIVFESDAFLKCSRETLQSILEIEDLAYNPKKVFDACMMWADFACKKAKWAPGNLENYKKQLGACFDLIPFNLMDPKDISECVTEYKQLFEPDEFVDLIKIITLDDTAELTKLRKRDNKLSDREWKWQWLSDIPAEYKQWIKQREVIPMPAYNCKCLFTAIKPFLILNDHEIDNEILSGTMEIVSTDASSDYTEVLLVQQIEIQTETRRRPSTQVIKFREPIMHFGNPSKKYHIRLSFDSSWSEKKFFTMKICGRDSHVMPFICYDFVS